MPPPAAHPSRPRTAGPASILTVVTPAPGVITRRHRQTWPGAADRPDAQRPAGHQTGHQARRQLTEPGPVAGPLPARVGHGRPRPCLTDGPGTAADHSQPAAGPLRYAAAGPERSPAGAAARTRRP